MISKNFRNIIMGALFGESAGLDNVRGIQYLGFGEGKRVWDSGIIEPVAFEASGLYAEKFRKEPDSIYFTQDLNISGTQISFISSSGIIAELSKNYPTNHLNKLRINIQSGISGNTVNIDRIVDSFTSGTNAILFDTNISNLNQIESFQINDVIAMSGDITENLLFNFTLRLGEIEQFNCREEALIGGIATKTNFMTGEAAKIARFKNRPTGGNNIIVKRTYQMKIPSGLLVNSDINNV